MAVLAAYNFDEASGPVLDRSGNGHDWALNNGAERTAGGHDNGGITRDGAGAMPVLAEPAIGETANRTVMFWQQGLGDAVWWIRWTQGADTATWGIFNIGGALRARAVTGSGQINAVGPAPPSDGEYHHYAATYDGTSVRLFIDATQVASASGTGTIIAADRIDFMEHTLPNFADDNLRIFDEALDQAAIETWMNTPVTSGPAPVPELATSLPVVIDLGASLDTPPASVPQLGTTLALAVDLTAGLDTPLASVPQLATSLPVLVDLGGELDAPSVGVPQLATSLPLAVGLGGALDQPPATVPQLATALDLVVDVSAGLSDPSVQQPPRPMLAAVSDRLTLSAIRDPLTLAPAEGG